MSPNAEFGVLIADDEPAARRGVRQLLAPYTNFHVVGECRDGAEVLASLDSLEAHVIFLDIQMPGIDGFDVIRRRTPERMPAIVFLTAYDQFAIKAFEAQALDYLLKPVAAARFAATMQRLTRQLRGRSTAADAAIVAATSRGSVVIPVNEIDWIESSDNYSRIWSGGRSYLLREPLRTLEHRVRAYGFERAHRCALVRLASVRKLAVTNAGELVAVLESGARIPVSRRRRTLFTSAIKSLKP
ncbi:MAG: LytTr DNA-binding region [Gemmatimonadetes bacterium]|nr:LytTr DNA-binding region [Gemmatimonadota bacterium]